MANVCQPSMMLTAENSRLSKSSSNAPVTFPVFSIRTDTMFSNASGLISSAWCSICSKEEAPRSPRR